MSKKYDRSEADGCTARVGAALRTAIESQGGVLNIRPYMGG